MKTTIDLTCPNCGSTLKVERGRDMLFCQYCGTQIMLNNENIHTYRTIDEADLKRAETEQQVEQNRLEMKKYQEKVSSEKTKYRMIGIVAIIIVIFTFLTVVPDLLDILKYKIM